MFKDNPQNVTYQKLTERVNAMVALLDDYARDFHINQHVDRFYYIQKRSELELIQEQLDELSARTSVMHGYMELKCREVFCQWKQDVRWLNKHMAVSDQST